MPTSRLGMAELKGLLGVATGAAAALLLATAVQQPAELERGAEMAEVAGSSDESIAAFVGPVIAATKVAALAVSGDADNDTKADPNDTLQYTVTITNSGTDATGVQFNDTIDSNTTLVPGSVHVSPVALNDSYTTIGNTELCVGTTPAGNHAAFTVVSSNGVLANDVAINAAGGTDSFSLTGGTFASAQNGSVTMTGGTVGSTNVGKFSYTPPAGFTGTDTFTYTLTNDADTSLTGTGTVSITISNKVWYVDSAAAINGNGTSSFPFNTLSGATVNALSGSGDVDSTTDTIYLYSSATNYTNGLILEGSQQLIGGGVDLVVNSINLKAAGSNPTLVNASGSGISLATNNLVRGLNLGDCSSPALSGLSFGTLTIDTVSINNSTSGAISLNNGTFAANAAFTSVSSSGGTNGIALIAIIGSVDLGSGACSGASGATFNVSGGSVSTTFSGNLTQANNAETVRVINGHTGTLTFNTGTLSATNGTGLQFDNADGTYNFNGTTTLNGGDAGIDILNGSVGSFSFGTGTSITNPSGAAFNLAGGTPSNANVTYSGNISKNNAGQIINIDNHDAGTITFQTGTINASSSSGGIRVLNSNGGTINFNSISIALTTGANNAVSLDTNNIAGAINFNPGGGGNGLDISTTSGTGFSCLGGGTLTVQGTGNTINSSSGTALTLANTLISGGGLTFASITSGGGTNGIKLASVTGFSMNLGSGSLSGSSGPAFLVGDGIGGANTGGSSSITYDGSITSTGTARAVDIQDRIAGSITLTGTITHSSGNATAIFLDDNAGGTIQFSGANSELNGGTQDAVHLSDNSGATINFTGGGLNIDATAGAGLNATGGGTISVTGSGNTIGTGSGMALNVASTNIGASGLTFQSIAATSAVQGIVLNGTGTAGGLTVTGTGSANSGGTINTNGNGSAAAGAGFNGDAITLKNTRLVSLSWMKLEPVGGNGPHGLYAEEWLGTSGNTLSNLVIKGFKENNLCIKNSTRSGSGTTKDVITIANGNIADLPGPGGSTGLRLECGGLNTAAAYTSLAITNTTFKDNRGAGLQGLSYDDGTGFFDVGTCTFDSSNTGSYQTSGISICATNSSKFYFNIHANTSTFKCRRASLVNLVGFDTANVTGIVQSNDLDGGSDFGSGVRMVLEGNANGVVQVNGNTINNLTIGRGIDIQSRQGNGSIHATVTANSITALANSGDGVYVASGNGETGESNDIVLHCSGNTATGGATKHGIFVEQWTGNTFAIKNLPGTQTTAPPIVTHLQNTNTANAEVSPAGSGVIINYTPSAAGEPNLPSIPLLAVEGAGPGATSIGADDLTIASAAALQRWEERGLSDGERQLLSLARVELADLPAGHLGETFMYQVRIDRTAAGWGWFVDRTPDQDEEFSSGAKQAQPGSAAFERMDLLTVLMHEYGHVMGRIHAPGLMSETLATGQRRLPDAWLSGALALARMDAAAEANDPRDGGAAQGPLAPEPVADPPAPPAGENTPPEDGVAEVAGEAAAEVVAQGAVSGVSVGPFDLPANKSITIKFQVTINSPATFGQVSNQGTVSGNFSNVLTDDPAVIGPANPTVTIVDAPPTLSGIFETNATGTDNAPVSNLFAGIVVGDPNNPNDLVVDIQLSAAANGTLSGGGFAAQGGGLYRLTGQSPASATTALDSVVFTPTPNQVAVGNTVVTTFTVGVDDGNGPGRPVTDNTTQVTITSISVAPAGADNTVTITEDTAHVFAAADFGFSDPNDSPANTLLAVKITTLPLAGTLKNNNLAVSASQSIPLADLNAGLLIYTPALNGNGSPYTSFTFQVQDNGGTANGGADLDASPNTLTFNVTAVNDDPVAVNDTASTNEDAGLTLSAATLLANDTDVDNDTLSISSVQSPVNGTVVLNGGGVSVTFTPAANYNGAASFTYTISDSHGGNSTATVNVTVISVNDAPAGTDKTITINQNSSYAFTASDFGYSDLNDSPVNSFQAVKITTLPLAGSLANNGSAVSTGDVIALSDLTAGHLVFTPAANASGIGYASFNFQVQDDGGTLNGGANLDQAPNTMTFNVNSANSAPAGTDKTVTFNEDTAYTIVAADFGFTDPNDLPAHNFQAVQITSLPGAGTLTNDGAAVTANDFIAITDVNAGHLVFTPAANANGNGYASFTFKVQDDGGIANGGVDLDQTNNTLAFNVTSVNDAPAGADHAVTTQEDTAHVFLASDFAIADPNDGPVNNLLAVKIMTLPAVGTLSDNGLPVTTGQSVPVADINAGLLRFTPVANANGAAYTSFTFQVQDDGGTLNGGADFDPTPNTLTINVTAVNDRPVLANVPANASFNENAAPLTLASGATVSDVDSPNLVSATVTITGGLLAGDVLAADTTGTSISAGYVNGVLALSGSDTLAHYQQVLQSVTFQNPSENPTNFGANPARTLAWALDDGTDTNSPVPGTTLTINASNDAPVLDLDADNSSGKSGADYTALLASTPVPVADTDTGITDVDNTNLQSATITLTNPQVNDLLSVNGALPAGISVDGTSTATLLKLTGSVSLASYQTALHQVVFSTGVNPVTTDRTITVVVHDGGGNSNTATTTITLNQQPSLGSGPSVTPDPVYLPGTATADVLASDPESDPLTYTWDTTAVPAGGVATFSPSGTSSQSSRTVSFNIEGTYTLRVTVSDGHQSVQGTVSVTVLPGVAVTASDNYAWEGGGNPGEFTITRAGSTTGPLTVHYTMSGTAVNGTDYTLLSGTATILAGNSSVTVPVTPLQDGLVENKETVILTLATDPAYGIGTPDHALVDLFDDELPMLSIVANGNAAEPSTGTSFTITRQGSLSGLLTVKYTTSGTATYGADYTLTSPPASQVGTALIQNGSASVVVNLNVLDDGISEANETVILTLTPQGTYQISPSNQATAAIVDNENHAPQILGTPFATPDPVRMPRRAFVDVSATDQDAGQTLTYTWTKVSGPGTVTFDPAGGQVSSSRMAAFSLPGNYVLRVTVSDGVVSVTGDVSITVLAPLGDANGDGKVDILFRHPVSGDVQLWIGL